jgi:dienelactone hydrolase
VRIAYAKKWVANLSKKRIRVLASVGSERKQQSAHRPKQGKITMLPTTLHWIGITLLTLSSLTTAVAQELKTSLAAGETGKVYFNSANRNTGIDILYKGKAKYDEAIWGELVVPEAAGKVPAMVIMHGSGGVEGGTSRAWASFFNQMGIATFIVDSFTPRGVQGTGSDQAQITYTTSGIDGLKALQLLASHPRIDANRIGQIGFSRGGVATQESSFEKFRAAVIPGSLKFALHIPLYGGCVQYGTTTGSPVLHLMGEEDGFGSVEQCRKTTELTNAKGGNVRLIALPGVLHGFDSASSPRSQSVGNSNFRNVICIEDSMQIIQSSVGPSSP